MTHSQSPSESDAALPPDGAQAAIPFALGRIPSGLFIVTWREAARDRGMLASWVMQAGFSPPMISIAVAPGRDLLAAIDSGARVVVNVLAESQRGLLARFGKPASAGEHRNWISISPYPRSPETRWRARPSVYDKNPRDAQPRGSFFYMFTAAA